MTKVKSNVHVFYNDDYWMDCWVVRRTLGPVSDKLFDSKSSAIKYGISLAAENGLIVYIHDKKSGRITDRRDYRHETWQNKSDLIDRIDALESELEAAVEVHWASAKKFLAASPVKGKRSGA